MNQVSISTPAEFTSRPCQRWWALASATLILGTGCGGRATSLVEGKDGGMGRLSAETADASTVGEGSADAESDEAPAAYPCESPQDCTAHQVPGPQVYCCIDHVCIVGQAGESQSCDDPDAQVIQASNYDQSCTTDSDCVAVAEGSFCYPGAGRCPSAAIRTSALTQYQADVSKTFAAACVVFGDCAISVGPCCRAGICQLGVACFPSPVDALPACADAGGSCGTLASGCGGHGVGPPDSCAYPDETCCLP
ncbi:MAG: hypothetical protein WBY94_27970 [Polyangiaceae bacterium]